MRSPIGARDGVIHPLGVTRSKRNNPSGAPFDAALPYTATAALTLALGSAVAFTNPLRHRVPTLFFGAAHNQAV